MTAINNNKKISCPHNVDKVNGYIRQCTYEYWCYIRVTTIHKCIYGTIIRGHCGFKDSTVTSLQTFTTEWARARQAGSYRGVMIQRGSMWKRKADCQNEHGSDLSPTLTLFTVTATLSRLENLTQSVSLSMYSTGAQRQKVNQSALSRPGDHCTCAGEVWHSLGWTETTNDKDYNSGYDTERGDAETKWKSNPKHQTPWFCTCK